MRKLLIIPVLLLAACSQEPLLSPEKAEMPDRVVYQAQGYFNAAVVLETAYGNLPRCGKPASPPICSDIAVMRKVRKVDDIAYEAIMAAQVAVRTPGFGEDKITTFVTSAAALTNAFSDITETLPHRKEQ